MTPNLRNVALVKSGFDLSDFSLILHAHVFTKDHWQAGLWWTGEVVPLMEDERCMANMYNSYTSPVPLV